MYISLINATAINGLGAAYSFGPEFAAALAVIAVALTGDPIGGRWSIGGPFTPALGGLLSTPDGISYSHNTYESDASIVRVSSMQDFINVPSANKC